jgi:hypothetical protein
MRATVAAALAAILSQESALGAGHGPVFALATPTNPKGGWSLDLSAMGRGGQTGVTPMFAFWPGMG